METMAAFAALIKILASLLTLGLLIYGVAVEHDAKRKLTELITSGVIFAVLMSMQFLIPKLAGPNSQALRDICTAWDPTPLFSQN